jgi:predicted Zn-dependent peptidase
VSLWCTPVVLLCLALLLAAAPLLAQETLKVPAYTKTTLPNGVVLFLMEKHNTPLVSFAVALRTGSVEDPPGKEGLAGLTNDLLRKGTKTRSADQIASELDFIGASFGTSESPDWLRIRAEFMKKDLDTGLGLLDDVLRNPVFPAEEVEKLKKQRIDGIRAAKDQAGGVIRTYYTALLYANHPYGRPAGGDEKSLAAIARDDVVQFHREHYLAGNMIVAVVGDFDTPAMEKLLAARFGSLPAGKAAAKPLPAPLAVTGRRLLLVDKPDSTQTYFVFGNVGIARTNPDRVAIGVVNTLFGGRFTSLINSALRIQSGLTYGANSSFSQMRQPGPFVISSYTRNATTEKALDMALSVLREFHEKGVSDEQLQSARAYLKGQFPTSIERIDQLTSLLADFEIYGTNEKEINEYYQRVDAVDLAAARRVIKQYFPLDNYAMVLIGKASEIGTLAKKYASDVRTKSISEPGF